MGSDKRIRAGISEEEYDEYFDHIGGVCEICKRESDVRLGIDHDHSCCDTYPLCGNCIRGFLCARCNSKLGRVEGEFTPEGMRAKILEDLDTPLDHTIGFPTSWWVSAYQYLIRGHLKRVPRGYVLRG